jgi:dUTP pyrophosphatase
MVKFEKISKYENTDINLPSRKTEFSAGYDFEVAEDIIIPSYFDCVERLKIENANELLTLEQMANLTKITKTKPTLVPTGIKCSLDKNTYLELSVRSSCPLKYWLVLANSVGIIDADYYNNPDNEGHIYFQMINLNPYDIQLKKGDIIGQGIIKPYLITDDDTASGKR